MRKPVATPDGQDVLAATWDGGALIILDPDGAVVSAGEAAAVLFSQPVIGACLDSLCAPEDQAAVRAALDQSEASTILITLSSAGQAPSRQLEVRFSQRDSTRRLVFLIDRTADQKALSQAQRDAKLNLDLLADLSHEMRTPLNAVIGFAGAMRDETFGPLGAPKYLEYADHIAMSGGHLKDLVSSILDLAKLEARGGPSDVQREMTDLGALARNCVAMLDAPAREAGLALDVEVEGGAPLSYLNARSIRQILINLLTNAVKFTSDGGIKVDVAADGEQSLVITVADTGIGMSPEELQRLGARFTSVHGKGVRGAGGAGLGLALAFALAEAEGGELTLDSAPGEGVTARLRLPIRAAPQRGTAQSGASADKNENAENGAAAIQSQLDRIEVLRREINANKKQARNAA